MTGDPSDRDVVPTLSQGVGRWIGRFPGLGKVMIDEDGAVEVIPALRHGSDDTLESRDRALRYGWAEPLSFVRRGFHHAAGATVAPPQSDSCLVLTGDPHDVAQVLLELAAHHWRVLADRPAPLRWHTTELMAYPRQAPIIMAKRWVTKYQGDQEMVRADTDSMIVPLQRATEPHGVGGILAVSVSGGQPAGLERRTGHARFEAAMSLFMRGVFQLPAGDAAGTPLGVDSDSARLFPEHLRLAQLPSARVLLSESIEDDVAEVISWCNSVRDRS